MGAGRKELGHKPFKLEKRNRNSESAGDGWEGGAKGGKLQEQLPAYGAQLDTRDGREAGTGRERIVLLGTQHKT